MIEQHNHHCLLTFMGLNWSIFRVRRHLVDVHRIAMGCRVLGTIDIADVDFGAYAAAVSAWEAARERA